MPRFYFDLRDHTGLTADQVGVELDGPAEAIQAAKRALSAMALASDTPGMRRTMWLEVRENSSTIAVVTSLMEVLLPVEREV